MTQLTVAAVPTAPGATVVITPTDADPDTPEHEIDLGRGDFKIYDARSPRRTATTTRTYRGCRYGTIACGCSTVGHMHIELQPTTTDYSIVVPEEVTEVRLDYGRTASRPKLKRGAAHMFRSDQGDVSAGAYLGRQVLAGARSDECRGDGAWSKHRLTRQVYNLADHPGGGAGRGRRCEAERAAVERGHGDQRSIRWSFGTG